MNTNSNVDGRKRCKCKKSECLKLYCECFAAEFYCDKHCSCQGCYNTTDYEDTVEAAREEIELRNPLAFSPKIQSLEHGDRLVEEHTKGCNCRKSMCQRKYCECYRAKVGCSVGCRCEGCGNVYGKKAVYNVRAIREPDIKKSDSFRLGLPELHNLPNLTPWAPPPYHGYNTSTVALFNPPPGYDNMVLGNIPMYQQRPIVEFRDQFTPPQAPPPYHGHNTSTVALFNPPPGYDSMMLGNIPMYQQRPVVEFKDQFTPPQAPPPYHGHNTSTVALFNPPPGYDNMMLGNIPMSQQHPLVEFMDEYTPPQDTSVISMMNLPPVNVMEWPSSSRAYGSSLPVAATPLYLTGGNGNPNINTSNGHSVPDAGSSTNSPGEW